MCCNLGEKLVPFLQVQGCTSPPEFQIWYLSSLGTSGCSAELVGVTVVSQTPRYCHDIWMRLLFSVLKPTCFKGHDNMHKCFGCFFSFPVFFFFSFIVFFFFPLDPWNETPLDYVLTYFHFPQKLLWLLQLPCSLRVRDLSSETQLLKCSQKFLYQYSSSMSCLVLKCPCQKKSTEVMLCVLYKWEGGKKARV